MFQAPFDGSASESTPADGAVQAMDVLGGKGGRPIAVARPQQKYDRTPFRDQYGFWADFVHPTAMAEGAFVD
ncbi:hypothetical protein [Peristeroidobacter agariperforans]|uniref:hypothetical protein n=1 Tax=Peristeroidobacter agariperforans TaxID=268404 RepID=UPI00101B9B53|nr:hypothetical protein [Peristeroidobacter agariperforans]